MSSFILLKRDEVTLSSCFLRERRERLVGDGAGEGEDDGGEDVPGPENQTPGERSCRHDPGLSDPARHGGLTVSQR